MNQTQANQLKRLKFVGQSIILPLLLRLFLSALLAVILGITSGMILSYFNTRSGPDSEYGIAYMSLIIVPTITFLAANIGFALHALKHGTFPRGVINALLIINGLPMAYFIVVFLLISFGY